MAEKFQIRIILKNSSEFTVKCDEFNCKKNGLGQLTGISWVGGTENIPLFLDINEIVAIIQLDTILSTDFSPWKHGHWIEEYDCGYITPHCSECGETALTKEETSYDYVYSSYCPRCGAKLC